MIKFWISQRYIFPFYSFLLILSYFPVFQCRGPIKAVRAEPPYPGYEEEVCFKSTIELPRDCFINFFQFMYDLNGLREIYRYTKKSPTTNPEVDISKAGRFADYFDYSQVDNPCLIKLNFSRKILRGEYVYRLKCGSRPEEGFTYKLYISLRRNVSFIQNYVMDPVPPKHEEKLCFTTEFENKYNCYIEEFRFDYTFENDFEPIFRRFKPDKQSSAYLNWTEKFYETLFKIKDYSVCLNKYNQKFPVKSRVFIVYGALKSCTLNHAEDSKYLEYSKGEVITDEYTEAGGKTGETKVDTEPITAAIATTKVKEITTESDQTEPPSKTSQLTVFPSFWILWILFYIHNTKLHNSVSSR